MSDGQKSYIQIAAEEAKKAALRGEVPVGAVLVDGVQDKILAKDGNRMREQSNPTAHAELLVIQKGCSKLNKIHLLGCDLYVTLEPCPMCAQAMAFARIRRLYFGAYDLSQSLGFPGDVKNPKVISEIEIAVKKVISSGKIAGGFVPQTKDEINWLLDLGIKFITYNVDTDLLLNSSNRIVNWFESKI